MILLSDCERFVREFFPIIQSSPQQVYQSALIFPPSETLLRVKYSQELPQIRMYNGCEKVWNSCLQTIDGGAVVFSVAISPDGQRLVTGSFDKTVQLWDAVSGAHLNTFKGHSEAVLSVSYSQDGTRIASGSNDNTIRLWDAVRVGLGQY